MWAVGSRNSWKCCAVTVRVMLADMPGLSSSRNTLVIVLRASPGQFAGCAARRRAIAGEQDCKMFVSIRRNILAMNPIGNKQGLQARGIRALYVGQKPIPNRQGAPGRMSKDGPQGGQR